MDISLFTRLEFSDSNELFSYNGSILASNQLEKSREILSTYLTRFEIFRDYDINSSNFFKFRLSFRDFTSFDPLLTNVKYNFKQNYYHLFNINNYVKFQLMQQFTDYKYTDIIDYYRLGLFAKIIKRTGTVNSIFLSLQSYFTFLPNWKIDENKSRKDITSTLFLSFSRYLTRNFVFTLKYQIYYNYSSAEVPQLDIEYFLIETPDEEESIDIAKDFYNYFMHVLSVDFLRYFSRNFFIKLDLKLENKQFTERKAYWADGNLKKEKERDFNITSKVSFIRKNFPFKNIITTLDFTYENRSSNNEYEGYYYYNIEKYFVDLSLIYEF